MMQKTPKEKIQIRTTATMEVCPPTNQPQMVKKVAIRSTTRIAPVSCQLGMEDQKGPLARVMKMSQFLGEGNLEEDDGVEATKVLDNTTVLATNVHGGDGNPGADSQDDTEQDGHSPELGKVPLDRALAVGSIVVGNGQGGNISEDGNEDNKLDVQAAVEDGNPETKVDLEMDRQGDTVDDVGVHAVENLAGGLEGIDDGTETRGKEDDIGSRAGSVGSTLDGNTGIGLLQGRRIVDTVTGHGNKVTTLLKNLDDVVLVLGEDLGETISSLDEIVDLEIRACHRRHRDRDARRCRRWCRGLAGEKSHGRYRRRHQ